MEIDLYVSADLTADVLRGGERHALHVARLLHDRGHSMQLVCRSEVAQVRRTTVKGLPVTALPRTALPSALWRLGACATVRPLAKQIHVHARRPDLVLAFSPWLTLAACRAWPKTKVIQIVADLLAASEAYERRGTFAFPRGSWLALGPNAWAERRAYDRCACSIVSSQWMRDGLATSGVDPARLHVAYPGPSVVADEDPNARRRVRAVRDRLGRLGCALRWCLDRPKERKCAYRRPGCGGG